MTLALRRGDIWLADFGADPQGPEQAHRRPALIVSDDRLHHQRLRMVIVIPGISSVRHLPIHVSVDSTPESGLAVQTAFQVEQVRSISSARLIRRLGRLDAVKQFEVDQLLRNVLNL